jgi:hypothetical protein
MTFSTGGLEPCSQMLAMGFSGVSALAGMPGAHLDTAPMQHRGKRSADLRIGTNGRFPANFAGSEFGAPGSQDVPDGGMSAGLQLMFPVFFAF